MNNEIQTLFPLAGLVVLLLLIVGIYCLLMTRNFIRMLIGLEILTKAATLLIILAGYVSGRLALAQSLAITLIVIEVVVITVAAGVVINVFKRNRSLDVALMRNLKG